MICNLNPERFVQYGAIDIYKENPLCRVNSYSVALTPLETWEYETAGEIWLNPENGSTILSVSTDGKTFRDFYLDKAVVLKERVRFMLTAFRGNAVVQMAGLTTPRLVSTGQALNRFEIRPGLQIKSICTLFYQEKEQGFLFSGEAHSMLELTYVDRGTLHSAAEGQDFLLQQGDMVLYGPYQWHMQYADPDEAPCFVTLSFDAQGLDISELINRKLSPSQKAVDLLLNMLREQQQMEENAPDMMLCLLAQLLLILQREQHSEPEKPKAQYSVSNENEIICRARQYVRDHIREKLSVPGVAGGIDVSASYLTALFQKYLKISPGEYIRRIKLQESKQLLREGKLNITEIAEALQYSTVHHFSRQFKEKFGITPTAYAKSVRD